MPRQSSICAGPAFAPRCRMQVRLALHTAFFILSVSLVMSAAINPAGTARVLRRQALRVAAVVRTVPPAAPAAATAQRDAAPSTPTGLIGSAQPRRADR